MKKSKQHKTRSIHSRLISLIGIFVILSGIIAGVLLWHFTINNASAASVQTTPTLKMTSDDIRTSILPHYLMYDMAVDMGLPANLADAAPVKIPCLQSKTPPLCYSPQQIRQAYGVQALLDQGITGKGRIITIIDAFQDPAIKQELHIFDQLFGMQDPQLNILAPFGTTPFNPKDNLQVGFAGEIALDVEWAHAIAPNATIDLVLANVKQETLQGELTALLQATSFAVQHNLGSSISQSFGISESCAGTAFIKQEHQVFQMAQKQLQSVFASAGDMGSAVLQCDAKGNAVALKQGVNFPASDPLVSSVGGTTLLASPAGKYIGETTWNRSQRKNGATGGGVSSVFPRPAFQQLNVKSQNRAVSDISLDADPLTGVLVVSSEVMPGKTVILPFGGTSVGSPVIAGMVALFTQANGGKRLGFLNSAFYRITHSNMYAQMFHDVTKGNNAFFFKGQTIPGFQAGVNWDPPTGVGSPDAMNLAKMLMNFIQPNDGVGL